MNNPKKSSTHLILEWDESTSGHLFVQPIGDHSINVNNCKNLKDSVVNNAENSDV